MSGGPRRWAIRMGAKQYLFATTDQLRDLERSEVRTTPSGLRYVVAGRYRKTRGHGSHCPRHMSGRYWRVGEGLLHAAYLAGRLDGTSVSFDARYTGLRGRRLVHWARLMEYPDVAGGVSQDDSVTLTTLADTNTVTANLVDVVHSLLSPLHGLFNFTRLPVDIVRHELKLLRERS